MHARHFNTLNAMTSTCGIALKEWAATCAALGAGRQILLLRKGGIADAGGIFELEHAQFWLWPTGFHQSATLLKSDDRKYLQSEPSDKKHLQFSLFAQAVQTWEIAPEALQVLGDLRHIWSQSYLDIRANYHQEHSLLCVALRVWEIPTPHVVEMKSEYGGCKSWIALNEELSTQSATPIMDEKQFDKYLQELDGALRNGASC